VPAASLRDHPADARSAALHKPSARVRTSSRLPPFRRLRLEMAEREGFEPFSRFPYLAATFTYICLCVTYEIRL
jgi:hypothetical protein